MVFSNFPSNAPHIFINLSAAVITDKRLMNITCYVRERARERHTHTHTVQQTTSERVRVRERGAGLHSQELASHSPLGLNLTEETAFVWPARVNFRL